MNETEAEARRLLAAATEDMPEGIDLLAGFAPARRRDRVRRMRTRAVLGAGIAAAATVTAVTLTVGSAPPALATVTTALTRTLAQSYHLTEQTSMYYIYNGHIESPSHGTCTSQEDPVRHLEAFSGSACPTERVVGGYTYIYIGDTVGRPGRHWARTPTAGILHLPLFDAIGRFTTATPQQMLSQIKQAAKVTVAGPASGPGWNGTRYAFSGSQGAQIKNSGTVSVDQQGRARELVLTTRFTAVDGTVLVTTWVLTFSDFGAPVIVTPPPADQIFPGP